MIELFRKEVLERQGTRLQGDIFLALPVSWQALGYVLFAALLAAAAFLFSTSYTQFQPVTGVIAPDKGVALVAPSRAGLVMEIFVKEGSRVTRGTPLARVRVAEVLNSGGASSDQLVTALAGEEQGIVREADALRAVSDREAERQAEQIRGFEGELAAIRTQMEVQRQLLASAREDLESVRGVAGNGFISRRDLAAREEALMVRRQQLAQLEQNYAAKSAALADARRAVRQLSARASAERAAALVRLRALDRQRVDAASADGYLITAPVDGVATAISARVGQAVTSTSAIMSIVPAGSALRAELSVPANVIGFVRQGQQVRLAIDGFPVEQFGTVEARVLSVPLSTVLRTDSDGNAVAVYPVACEIRTASARPGRGTLALVPGMTFRGRIAMRRRALGQWLLSPLASLGQP